MALSGGRERFSAEPFADQRAVLVKRWVCPPTVPCCLQTVVTEELFGRQRIQVASREPGGAPGSFRVHARGFLKRRKPSRSLPPVDLAALRDRLVPYATDDANQPYAELNAMGMEYGEAFRGLRQLWCGERGPGPDRAARGRRESSGLCVSSSATRFLPAGPHGRAGTRAWQRPMAARAGDRAAGIRRSAA